MSGSNPISNSFDKLEVSYDVIKDTDDDDDDDDDSNDEEDNIQEDNEPLLNFERTNTIHANQQPTINHTNPPNRFGSYFFQRRRNNNSSFEESKVKNYDTEILRSNSSRSNASGMNPIKRTRTSDDAFSSSSDEDDEEDLERKIQEKKLNARITIGHTKGIEIKLEDERMKATGKEDEEKKEKQKEEDLIRKKEDEYIRAAEEVGESSEEDQNEYDKNVEEEEDIMLESEEENIEDDDIDDLDVDDEEEESTSASEIDDDIDDHNEHKYENEEGGEENIDRNLTKLDTAIHKADVTLDEDHVSDKYSIIQERYEDRDEHPDVNVYKQKPSAISEMKKNQQPQPQPQLLLQTKQRMPSLSTPTQSSAKEISSSESSSPEPSFSESSSVASSSSSVASSSSSVSSKKEDEQQEEEELEQEALISPKSTNADFVQEAELNVLDEIMEQNESITIESPPRIQSKSLITTSSTTTAPTSSTTATNTTSTTSTTHGRDPYRQSVPAYSSVSRPYPSSQPNKTNNNTNKKMSATSSTTVDDTNDNAINDEPTRMQQNNVTLPKPTPKMNMNTNNRTPSRAKENEEGGVIPDVLSSMRQRIESLTLFDPEMIRLTDVNSTGAGSSSVGGGSAGAGTSAADDYYNANSTIDEEERRSKEHLRRAFQQSISASILLSLSHKRYERRRHAAMDVEKVIRNLVQEKELERVRAILILLSDDYVRSTSEDARKGGVVALAACAIGLKKAEENDPLFSECKDLILASVVHACQDHNQRVRYYATESLFNVIKVLPPLAVQHFFILFEILRSLYADVDIDVRSGAQLLDKKLKEIIIAAINNGSLTTEACVPLFSRFIHMRNKPTKRLTLTWLQEFSEKLVGSPMVGFLHLFLGGVFAILADPNTSIRQGSLIFLETILPQLLGNNDDFEDSETSSYVDFDKILQSLVTTLEHPDPFVRKVAMYWTLQIIRTHFVDQNVRRNDESETSQQHISAASLSVRNSLPHVLPGVLLSIGDQFNNRATSKDTFLPGMTTRNLAEQTNECFQNAVRRDGKSYVSLLDGFIVALREELDAPGGLAARNPPAVERKPYRLDVKSDGTGIESTGWFRSNTNGDEPDDALMMSRLCALEWVIVLCENVVPHTLRAEYAREFISPIVHQMIDNPPEEIVIKSFEVLVKITTPVEGELSALSASQSKQGYDERLPEWAKTITPSPNEKASNKLDNEIMSEDIINFALGILSPSRGKLKSRDREVFRVLIHLYSRHHKLLADLSRVLKIMCKLQPAEFVYVSFAVELDHFVSKSWTKTMTAMASLTGTVEKASKQDDFARDLEFASCFIQQLNHVLLIAPETSELRYMLLDSIGRKSETDHGKRRAVLFQILLKSFAHNLAATLSLCLWGGAFMTISYCLQSIDPLDLNLLFYLELDQLIEMLERPIFRHLHLRMLESDADPYSEGSGAMLFRTLKSILMLLPQSTTYDVLKDRLLAISKYRKCAIFDRIAMDDEKRSIAMEFTGRIKEVRKWHCDAKWRAVRAESLEPVFLNPDPLNTPIVDEGDSRREWLGYADEQEEAETKEKMTNPQIQKLPDKEGYNEFHGMDDDQFQWKTYWIHNGVD